MSRYPCIKEKLVLELTLDELNALLDEATKKGIQIGRRQVHAEMHGYLTTVGYIKPATGAPAQVLAQQAPAQAPAATPPAATQQPAPATNQQQPAATPTNEVSEDSHVSQLGMSAEINAGFTELGILTVRELLKRGRRTLRSLFSNKEIDLIDAKLAELKLPKRAR